MNYRDALAWLYGTQTFGIKLGLDNTRLLMAAAGSPYLRLRFIHVAGTNGKGSVCAMLDSVLRASGVRAALFTSPHLVEFCERIRVDGAMIPREAAAEGIAMLREAASDWEHQPTFFEITAVLAAWWFARAGAEVVVWETGMGGRLDATNVVTPLVSVITPIGLDHQKWLGGTIGEIAAEKAGIIKPGVPVVSAVQPAEARTILQDKAHGSGSEIRFVDKPYDGIVGLAGAHQKWNAAVALAALDATGLVPDGEARAIGLASVQWPARFQQIGENLVIDGAHNAAAAEALAATWRDVFGECKAHLIFGALREKNPAEILRVLRGISDEVVVVPVNSARAAAPEEICAAAEKCGFSSVRSGRLAEVLEEVPEKPTLVTGSLFLAGEALALLDGAAPPRASDQ